MKQLPINHHKNSNNRSSSSPQVGIIGMGAFGVLAARTLEPFCNVVGFDINATPNDIHTVTLAEVLQSDWVIIAVPLQAYPQLLTSLKPHLKPNTTLIDICSVKIKPQELFAQHLPRHTNIVFTHPMFGPQSATSGVAGKTIVFTNPQLPASKAVSDFCSQQLGLTIAEMTAQHHDKIMAQMHALTFFVARGLHSYGLTPSEFQAPSFTMLLDLVDLDTAQTQELFETVENGNPFAAAARQKLIDDLTDIHHQLDQA